MNFFKFSLMLMACLLGHLAIYAGKVWTVEDIPIPYLKDSTQYVSDPECYLDTHCKDSANIYLQRLNVECGVQNVFVIVGRVANQNAFRMAQDLGNRYGVGSKRTRRGLVVVVAVEDHKYFIAPGMGLEGELTDVDCDDIARACIVPNMRNGQPARAVLETSRAIYNKVKTGRTEIPSVDEGTVDEENLPLVILCLILCFGMPVYAFIRYVLEEKGYVEKKNKQGRRRYDDEWFPPFFMGGGGFSGGNSSGGSFGGGSFGGGGSGGSW